MPPFQQDGFCLTDTSLISQVGDIGWVREGMRMGHGVHYSLCRTYRIEMKGSTLVRWSRGVYRGLSVSV